VKFPICSISLSLLLATGAAVAAPPDKFYLHPNDTVVFYGDSITDQRLYTMLTELYIVTRYPSLNVRFVHSGWGGDRVSGGGGGPIDQRLDRDVLTYKPTVMTIMLGMNDGRYTNHTPADDDAYYAGYHHIVETVRRAIPGLRITVIEPSPFDDVTRPITMQPDGYNAVLVKYGDWLREHASEANVDFADLNTGVVAVLKKANATDAATAQKILPDRVHPALAGHLIMAEQLLKAWNARASVSAVTIDAATGKIEQSDFTRISDLHAASGSTVSWNELDESLPLPLAGMLAADRDHTLDLTLRSSDITEALDEQPLRITGLSAGRFTLTIDGIIAGTWTNTELAQGVNLAVLDTPMSRQALKIRDLTVERIDIHQQRWRTVQVPLQDLNLEHLSEAEKGLDDLEADIVKNRQEAVQPRPHAFLLSPAS